MNDIKLCDHTDLSAEKTESRSDSSKLVNFINRSDKIVNTEVWGHFNSPKSTEIEEYTFATQKKKSKMKVTFDNVFRSLRSGADKLLTNFLSSGNYNRLIIATSAATAAMKRSSITDTDDEDEDKHPNATSFRCVPQLTVSLGKYLRFFFIIERWRQNKTV